MWMEPPFGIKKGLFPLLTSLFYMTNKETLAYYREGIFITDFQDFDIDYFFKTPHLVELRWLDMDAQTKHLLTALASIPAELDKSEIVSIEPLDVARALVATYDKIEPWAGRTIRLLIMLKRLEHYLNEQAILLNSPLTIYLQYR